MEEEVYESVDSHSSTPKDGDAAADGQPRDLRWLWFFCAVALFIISTYVAVTQDPRPNAYEAPTIASLDWWYYPLEFNAEKSLIRLEGNLNAIYAQPDGKHVCAVGDAGLILTSDDGGRTWTRRYVTIDKSKPPTDSPASANENASTTNDNADSNRDSPVQEPLGKEGPDPKKGASRDGQRDHFLEKPARLASFATPPQGDVEDPKSSTPNTSRRPNDLSNAANNPQVDPCDGKCKIYETCVDGKCVPVCEQDADCDDGNRCTIESCQKGICVGAEKQCPVEMHCNPKTGDCEDSLDPLISVHFSNELIGVATSGDLYENTFDRRVLVTQDGGRSWQWKESTIELVRRRRPEKPADTLLKAAIASEVHERLWLGVPTEVDHFFIPNESNEVTLISSAMASYVKAYTHTQKSLEQQDTDGWRWTVSYLNESTAWAVRYNTGTILKSEDGGHNWQIKLRDGGGLFLDIAFVDANHGWAFHEAGGLSITVDGGKTWMIEEGLHGRSISKCFFATPTLGWSIGNNGLLLSTADGGRTWFPQTQQAAFEPDSVNSKNATNREDGSAKEYERWPAPWYYVCLLAVVGLTSLTFIKPERIQLTRTVANKLVSDRPLGENDPDPLKLGKLARGISRYLRNTSTTSPLTIAVTGKWGSGKSSLMGLLKADLIRRGFSPIWFNAWHHQKEENLLAALLENVKAQAVPPVLSRAGTGFRFRLLRRRFHRFWPLGLLLSFIFGASLGYVTYDYSRNEGKNIRGLLADMRGFITGDKDSSNAIAATDAAGESGEAAPSDEVESDASETALLALLGTIIPPLVGVWKGLRAFGLRPGALMASSAGSLRVRDLDLQASFRHRFEKQFNDVTYALGPWRMVIFIDDLDRCRPDKLLEVFEAVNYLATAGECFIVMGMDRDQVTSAIVAELKDVSGAIPEDDEEGAPGSSIRARQIKFAQRYMEKLINIEVPVPTHPPTAAAKFLSGKTKQRGWFRRKWPAMKLAAMLAFVLGLCVYGVNYGVRQCKEAAQDVASAGEPQKASPSVGAVPSPIQPPSAQSKPVGVVRVEPGQPPTMLRWLTFVLLLVLVPVGLWGLSTKPEVTVSDSGDFTSALDVWVPMLYTKNDTPRAVKRFVNRVRYYAMLQRRDDSSRRSRTRKFFTTCKLFLRIPRRMISLIFRRGALPSPADAAVIPEGTLVGLAAAHQLDACRDHTVDRDVLNGYLQDSLKDVRDDERQKLWSAYDKHTAGMTPDQIERFSKLINGVHIA